MIELPVLPWFQRRTAAENVHSIKSRDDERKPHPKRTLIKFAISSTEKGFALKYLDLEDRKKGGRRIRNWRRIIQEGGHQERGDETWTEEE